MKIKRYYIFLLFLFFVQWNTASFAKTIYVAKSGSDSKGTGDIDRPLLTICKAVQLCNPGDTIYIREGIYREQIDIEKSGTKEARIMIQNFENENVIISGGEVKNKLTDWKNIEPNIWFTEGIFYEPCFIFFDGREGNHIKNIEELNTEKKWTWENNKIYVYSESNPASKNIDIPKRDYGFNICGLENNGEADYITIEGIIVTNVLAHGFACRYGADHIIIQNCKASFCGAYGKGYGNGFSIEHNCKNIIVRNCIAENIYDCGISLETANSKDDNDKITNCLIDNFVVKNTIRQYGILCWNNVENVLIKNCKIFNTASRGIFLHGEHHPCKNIIIEDCQIINSGKEGIYIRLNCDNIAIRDCHIESPESSGINIVLSSSNINICDTEIIQPSLFGIQIGLQSRKVRLNNCLIEGGILIGNGDHKSYMGEDVKIQNCTIAGQISLRCASGVLLKNSIIVSKDVEPLYFTEYSKKFKNHSLDYNNYFETNGKYHIIFFGNEGAITLTSFFRKSDHEKHGINENPNLTKDYFLKPESPCINAGDRNSSSYFSENYTTTGLTPDENILDLGYHHKFLKQDKNRQ